MKKDIHPRYMATLVKCGCGESFVTRSTVPEIKVDICSVCHPFYTGKLKYVDTAGRIEKFKTRYAATPSTEKPAAKKAEAPAPAPKKAEAASENRAAKRAKANAGKPKPEPKVEAAPAAEEPKAE